MSVEFVNRTIKSYSVRTSRVRKLWLGIFPTNKFVLRFNIVQTYNIEEFDNDNHCSRGTTIIHHELTKIVDWYDNMQLAEASLSYWNLNIGTQPQNMYEKRAAHA